MFVNIYKCYTRALRLAPHNSEPVERPRGLGYFYIEFCVPVVLDALDALDLVALHIQQAAQHGQRITLRPDAPALPHLRIYIRSVQRRKIPVPVAST